jgi:glycosyltransferase involved in cell wall biosynthesis
VKYSVCITTYNEERSIGNLLDSLLSQSKMPGEIVIVDAGSKDQTVSVIRHHQKKDSRIKFLIASGASRAKGRNMSVELAQNEIIAMTDAGCVAGKKWLERISEPFKNEGVELVAGFYNMVGDSALQKAFRVFLGTLPQDFSASFLPSTRSIAFRKSAFESIGGFRETLSDTAEDTVFNYNATSLGLKFTRVKNARVEWEMPKSLWEGIEKMYRYALGDARSGIWYHPVKGIMSHNIKAVFKLARYILGLFLIILSVMTPSFVLFLIGITFCYCVWAFRKVFIVTKSLKSGLWGIVLQFASDFAVILGLLRGTFVK